MKWSYAKNVLLILTRPWLWTVRPLRREALAPDPIQQFESWFRRARWCFWLEFPDAMCLSTLRSDGLPDGRFVLLKSFDQRGFVFYTNTLSAKGAALAKHPKAALSFYWEPLQRQVRIRGRIEGVSDGEADAYFASRLRGSQVGAWASQQSRPLQDRGELNERIAHYRQKFKDQSVPRPAHWHGYRVVPEEVEFWQLRANRLHDRFLYAKSAEGAWAITRLYP
jgi:pyridoxamine 5'-phosphate oxidase